jgi:hypothetical protein
MSNESSGLQRASGGGVAGTHDTPDEKPLLIGSSTESQINKIRSPLVPIACWRVDDIRFDFDSSFVRTEVKYELEHLKELVRPASGMSDFGLRTRRSGGH